RRHTSFSRDWSSDVCSSDLIFGYFALIAVHQLRLHEYHRIGIDDRRFQQSFRIVWIRGNNHFQTRAVGVPALKALGMLGPQLAGVARRATEHYGYGELATGHLQHLGS